MARIKKGNPPVFLLVPDTNILWHEDKSFAVNPAFETFLVDNQNLTPLKLVIPEMVKHELLFQQTTSALKALEKVNENISIISQITQSQHKSKISREQIRRQIESKFNSWLLLRKGIIAKTPYKEIDLEKICEKSVWRLPPFTFDPKNHDNEKGFRDSIILETVVDLANKKNSEDVLVFLCNDQLLKAEVIDKLSKDKSFLCYETLPDFSSYIRLTKEKLTNEFIKAISVRAENKFYTKGEPNCLYNKEKVWEKIIEQYSQDFSNPSEEKFSIISSMLTQKLDDNMWKPSDSGKWWLIKPEFERIEGVHEYHWKSVLSFIRNYKKTSLITDTEKKSLLDLIDLKEKTSFLHFNVFWKSIVKNDGRFYKIELVNIDLASKEFKFASREDRARYNITYEDSN